ncbi:pyridoxal phosphate-dependent aminotransferase [Halobacterium hubeiense]|uniref:Aminotransferase n=2 Tax=Halobacterium TaxID=2239 RepID=A0A0U5CY50_9EURY|nr:pyridoxal phosphate-dependent aminotransferase [Halobacterium hubeiense]CQH56592.1 pyridoxal phosphate-dependent aminotransferase [Halobacterium hubeiense]
MPEVTDRVRGVERSRIRMMFDRAERHDGDLVRLEVGEPDFDTPEHVVEAAVDAARGGDTHYTPNAGTLELREAVAGKFERERGASFDPDSEIMATVGGMEALHLALLATAEAGEEVLIPSPVYPNYEAQAKLADATPVNVPLDADAGYALDVEAVREALSAETSAVVLNSPANPTGQVFDRDAALDVVEAAAEHDAWVVSDEVYMGLTYDGPTRSLAADAETDNVLVVDSVSKQYAMTGWRVGWLAGPEHLISETTKIHEATTACPSSVAQAAATRALTGDQEPIEAMYDAFLERRNYVADRIADIEGVTAPTPDGAFYAFIDVSELGDDFEIAKELCDDYGVVLTPGSGFGPGGAGNLRLSFANSLDNLEAGLDRFEAFVADTY